MMSAVRMTKNPHLVYIDDYEDSDDDEVFADKPIHITPRKSCEKYVSCDKMNCSPHVFTKYWLIIW